VKREFAMLKSQFVIICGPSCNWQMGTMNNIILACIIFHDMIVQDEQDTCNIDVNDDYIDEEISNIGVSHGAHLYFVAYLQTSRYMHTKGVHQHFKQTWCSIFENISVTIMMKFNFCCSMSMFKFFMINFIYYHKFKLY